jgi:hypothetical protein
MRLKDILQRERAPHLSLSRDRHRPRPRLEFASPLGTVGLFCDKFVKVVVSRYILKGIWLLLQAHSRIFPMLERRRLDRARASEPTAPAAARLAMNSPVVVTIGGRDLYAPV